MSEKFFELCKLFGTENVGMLTGDASVNADAPVICCTAEVLASIALRDGKNADVGQVVMDEFHFYAEGDRGWAWQIPLLELPQAQFILMSATLGDVSFFEKDLTRRTGRPTSVVRSATRPVPLSYEYKLTPLTETLTDLLQSKQAPVYIVHFTQAQAVERAQALMSINMCSREEKDQIAELIGNFRSPPSSAATSPLRPARHRRAPRRHAAQVPAPGGEARPGRSAEGHLRYGHAGRGCQRAHPHRAVHGTDQVRRQPGAHPAGPGVPPDRGPGRPGRFRHRGARGRAGAGSTSSRTRRRWRRRATTRRSGARWCARRRRRALSAGRRTPSRS